MTDLAEVAGDVVVVAAGLRSGAAARRRRRDAVARPGRAARQPGADPVARRRRPPRRHDLRAAAPRLGRLRWHRRRAASWDTEPDPQVHEAILRRVREVVPELAGAQVLGARVGLRPVAPEVRLAASVPVGGPW